VHSFKNVKCRRNIAEALPTRCRWEGFHAD
jgi:hypothetical protein